MELKRLLTNAPVLVILEGNQDLVIYTDACGSSLGMVLMRRGCVVAYASRQLRPSEVSYATHILELTAIIFALKIWRPYLLGERFILYIDLKSLKYLFSQKYLNMQQQGWLEFLTVYDFEIEYTPCKGNRVADTLSRKHSAVVSMMLEEWKELEVLSSCDLRQRPVDGFSGVLLSSIVARPSLIERIAAKQSSDHACDHALDNHIHRLGTERLRRIQSIMSFILMEDFDQKVG